MSKDAPQANTFVTPPQPTASAPAPASHVFGQGNFDLGYWRPDSAESEPGYFSDDPNYNGNVDRNGNVKRLFYQRADYNRDHAAPPTPEQAAMTVIKQQVEESARKRSAGSVLTGAGLLEDNEDNRGRASRVLLDG